MKYKYYACSISLIVTAMANSSESWQPRYFSSSHNAIKYLRAQKLAWRPVSKGINRRMYSALPVPVAPVLAPNSASVREETKEIVEWLDRYEHTLLDLANQFAVLVAQGRGQGTPPE